MYLSKDKVREIIKNKPEGASSAGIISALRAKGYELEGYNKPQSSNVKKDKGSLTERITRTLLPKSVEGFAETLGTTAATPLINKINRSETEQNMELQDKVMEKIKDPNVSREQKDRLIKMSSELGFDITKEITALNKSAKTIASEGLGTLSYLGLGAAPMAGVGKRLAFGTAIGATSGIEKGLKEEGDVGEIAKEGFKGAAIGLGTGLAFEGIGKLVTKFRGVGKNTFNKELQPKAKDLTASIKYNAETVGEQIRNSVDDLGNPIYYGGYSKMKAQAEKELTTNNTKLLTTLQKYKNKKITQSQTVSGIFDNLEDEFGTLDKRQLDTVKKFIKKYIPNEMTPTEALEAKRLVDRSLSKTDWTKIMGGDTQATFASQVKANLRTGLRDNINISTGDDIVQELNNKLGIATEVRDLVSRRLAKDVSSKTKISFFGIIDEIIHNTIFSPAVTTRASQFTRGLGTNVGQTQVRQSSRTALIELLNKL